MVSAKPTKRAKTLSPVCPDALITRTTSTVLKVQYEGRGIGVGEATACAEVERTDEARASPEDVDGAARATDDDAGPEDVDGAARATDDDASPEDVDGAARATDDDATPATDGCTDEVKDEAVAEGTGVAKLVKSAKPPPKSTVTLGPGAL